MNSRWYKGSCSILSYELNELLGTKLRALYQRKSLPSAAGSDVDSAILSTISPADLQFGFCKNCFDSSLGWITVGLHKPVFLRKHIVLSMARHIQVNRDWCPVIVLLVGPTLD